MALNDRNSNKCLYIPTEKACRDFGIARFPTAYSSSNGAGDGIPDFMQGGQFSKSSSYVNTINNINTDGNPKGNKMDEVLIEVLSNKPYIPELREIEVNGIKEYKETYSTEAEVPIFYIRIAPTWDNISQNKQHDWGQPGGLFSTILDTVSDVAKGINDIQTSFSGNKKAHNVTQTDVTNEYTGSNREELDIEFILFTKNDFVNDIFYPLMTLTALSYPNRILDGVEELQRKMSEEIADENLSKKDRKKLDKELSENDQSVIDTISAGYRLNISKPPRFLRVSHSSNLFYYPHMNITNFSYQFERPFYNVSRNKLQVKSFPLVAKCSLTLLASDIMMKGDYLRMLTRFGSDDIEISQTNSRGG